MARNPLAYVNPVKDYAKAFRICDAAVADFDRIPNNKAGRKNGNKVNGWSLRYRVRLQREAGYDYNDALRAVRAIIHDHEAGH